MSAIRDGQVTAADGLGLYFRQLGDGPRLLVVPNGVPFLERLTGAAATHTIVAYDPRNRGQSGIATGPPSEKPLDDEVDDIDSVRQHFGAESIDLLGHSYTGLVAILYALRHPSRVGRVIQVGPPGPDGSIEYPRHPDDEAMLQGILAKVGALQRETGLDGEQKCRRFWEILRPLYVVDSRDVSQLDAWERCHLESERRAGEFVMTRIMPALRAIRLSDVDLEPVVAPVLTIHGCRDRSALPAGGREWARRLSNARLVSVDEAGHMPWIESPEEVLGAISTFLAGHWPVAAVSVQA
jgi:pimeloyl-ACP methyl ester carboxylesterase